MLDEQFVFNIFANTGSLEAYLLYTELKNKEKIDKEGKLDFFNFKGRNNKFI